MIFYSRSCIVCNVFISDIFEMFYAFLCILCILIQGTMVEQLCLNGFTLYKYICNKKKGRFEDTNQSVKQDWKLHFQNHIKISQGPMS